VHYTVNFFLREVNSLLHLTFSLVHLSLMHLMDSWILRIDIFSGVVPILNSA